MALITFITSFLFFLFCIVFFNNKPLNPATLFFGLWSFILILSYLNLYNIIKPSNQTYVLIFLMLVFYFMGSIIAMKVPIKIKYIEKNTNFNFNLYYILVVLAIIVAIYDCIIVIKYVLGGVPIWQVRNWALEEYGADNPIAGNRSFLEEFVRTVIIYPIGLLIPPIATYTFFDTAIKKNKKKILISAVLYLFLFCLSGGGGRLRIIYYIGCFLIAYLTISSKKYKENFRKKKYKKYIIILILISVVGIAGITYFRIGQGYLLQQIYTYFALPPTLLSEWLPEIKNEQFTFGFMTLFGIHSYFFRLLKMIGLDTCVPSIYNESYQYILDSQKFRNTGYGIGNAFVTPIYYFMHDGGIVFVCLASFVFGIVISTKYKQFTKKIDIKSFTIYALIMYGVFMTFQTTLTALPGYWIAFVFISIIMNNKKIIIRWK